MAKYLDVGIDFGASNLKAVYIDKGHRLCRLRLNRDEGMGYVTPTAIFYRKKKEAEGVDRIIGRIAINNGVTSPANLITGIKRKLASPNWSRTVPALDNRSITAPEVCQDIFSVIMKEVRGQAEKGVEIRAAVTVPVIYSKMQRQIMRRAAEKAGFIVGCIVNEPFAAVFSLADIFEGDDRLLLIFDFGGSTLDVSVVKTERDKERLRIKELAAAGIQLGGMDIDRAIYEKIVLRDFGDDIAQESKGVINYEERALRCVQAMKEELFGEQEESVRADAQEKMPEGFGNVEIRREDVDRLIEEGGYWEQVQEMLDRLFEDLLDTDGCYEKSDINSVWAFGGTCHIPYFMEKLTAEFGGQTSVNTDFEDEEVLANGIDDRYFAVAGGAVRYMDSRQKKGKLDIYNVIPFCIGYEKKGMFHRGIGRNSPFGFETVPIPIPLDQLEKDGWTFSVYQCFNNQDEMPLDAENGPVFIEKVKMDEAKYEKKESPVFRMKIMRDGKLRLQFSERRILDGEPDEVIVEESLIDLGG